MGGLARARTVPGTQVWLSPLHTLQSSKSSQHTGWKHPSLLPTRGYQGLSPSRPGSDNGGFSHVLCPAVYFLSSMDQGGGMGRGSLSLGCVDPPFLNSRRFLNRQPTEKPRLGVQHYPCRSPRPLAEGGKKHLPFFLQPCRQAELQGHKQEAGRQIPFKRVGHYPTANIPCRWLSSVTHPLDRKQRTYRGIWDLE